MSWFEEWFDSPLYEKLYSNRDHDEAKKLVEVIAKELPVKQYPRVLDLGCGRGRHSIALAEKGYKVTGIDLSRKAIRKAETIAKQKGLEITFGVRDMRRPLDQQFDSVVNLFTTFGYFADDSENRKVLGSVYTMLKPEGAFLIDFLNAEKVKRELVPEESGTYENLSYEIRRFIDDGAVYKKIRFEGEDLKKPVVYQERVKLYGPEWFEENLSECGFSIKKVRGDYSESEFNVEKSPRLLIVAEKEK